MTSSQAKVYYYLKEFGTEEVEVSISEMVQMLGLSRRAVYAAVAFLVEDGWIQKVASGGGGRLVNVYKVLK